VYAVRNFGSKVWVTFLGSLAILSLLISPVNGADKVVINLADSPPYTKGSPMCEFAVKFKELSAQYSDGVIEVQIYWGGQLGDEQKVFKDAQLGIIQAVIANIANLAPFSPVLYSLNLPYIFDTRDQAYKLFRGELGRFFTDETVKTAGLRVLAWPDQSFRALHNTKRRILKPDDMKGLKLRVPNNPVFISMYKSWGVDPIPMGWSEVFSSLQTGVLHGGDNVLRNLIDFKMYDLEKYATVSQHMLEIVPLVVGEKFFQSQPVKIREALTKAANDAWAWQFSAMGEDELQIKKKLRDLGMVVDEPDLTPWRKAREIWPQFYDKSGGKERFDRVISIIKK